MSIIKDVITHASKDLGTEESPRGSNRGRRVEEMLRTTGLAGGFPWCAAAVATWGRETAKTGGWSWPVPASADCDVLLSWARKRGFLHSEPKAGDIFLVMASESDATHTGLVTAVEDGGATAKTIEGNSNAGGSREGYAVVSRSRSVSSRLRFIRWADAVTDVPGQGLETPLWMLALQTGDTTPAMRLSSVWMVGGTAYYPARALLSRPELKGQAETAAHLSFNAGDNTLEWDKEPIPAQVALREGTAYAAVRGLAGWLGRSLSVDSETRTITLRKAGG